MINKNIFVFIFMGIFLLSLTSADLGDYEQGEEVSVRGDLTATSVNVTIYFPNSSIAINNQLMTNSHGEIWNYSFTLTETIGLYIYDYCDQNGNNCVENFFEITNTGQLLNDSQLISVFAMTMVMFMFFGLGRVFSKNRWMLALMFDTLGLGMAVLALNSARIISSQSDNLTTMGLISVIVGMIVLMLMIAYFLIIMTIYLINKIKNREERRWETSENPY